MRSYLHSEKGCIGNIALDIITRVRFLKTRHVIDYDKKSIKDDDIENKKDRKQMPRKGQTNNKNVMKLNETAIYN